MFTFRLAIICLLLVAVGCASFNANVKKSLAPLFDRAPTAEEEEKHREAFQETRDPRDLHWLLAHRIESGMTVKEVENVLGEPGIRVDRDSWIKNEYGSGYQATDDVWKWKAASDGKAIYLVFREGTLVNFDPAEFASPEDDWE